MTTVTAADILIHRADGGLVAAVEVKNRKGLTVNIAMTLRLNLVRHGSVPDAPYFLMASEDHGYLWKGTAVSESNAAPSATFSMAPVIEQYVPQRPDRRLRGAELGVAVFAWLSDLAFGAHEQLNAAEQALESGDFVSAIRNSIVTANLNYLNNLAP